MKVSVITNRGVGIVRSAANRHEKCEIVDCVSSTHFENTANELATKSGEWWDGATGTITMVRAGNGSLKVSVSFPATSYAQPLKSIGIRVKAQGDERAHILYAVSDGNTAIALNRPYTCDYEIPINVSSDTIEDVGSEPVPGLEDYYTKSETDTQISSAITALNLGAAAQKAVDSSIGDASSSNLPTSDAVKAYVNAHSGGGGGGVDTSNLGASLFYDSEAKQIELKNTSDAVISSIDATAFVKDGMVNNVAIVGDYLVITFNTDAGKEAINIPMSSFFDASAYYTKTEVDNKGYCTEAEVNANHYTKSEIDGGYIANASYNNATNTLTLSSKDGSKQIDLDLS